jgi:hypothetical protein
LRAVKNSVTRPPAKCARTLVFIILPGLLLRARPPRPFYAADSLDSPRIASLKKSIEAGDRAATLTSFWEEVRKITTPLVEPVGDAQYSCRRIAIRTRQVPKRSAQFKSVPDQACNYA